MIKPFSQACANNGPYILEHLARLLSDKQSVLEFASGTGQHAVAFAKHLPHLQWQPTDLIESLAGIQQWIEESEVDNVQPPIEFDIANPPSGLPKADVIFTSNSLHWVSWPLVKNLFELLPKQLNPKGLLVVYGPFNYHGQFTSESNESFDQWLKATDEVRGIRDFEKVDELAKSYGFSLLEDNPMPANNRLLVWQYLAD